MAGFSCTISERVAELEKFYGGLNKAARAIKVDAGYLVKLRDGDKKNPSALTLWRMGLRRRIVYERI